MTTLLSSDRDHAIDRLAASAPDLEIRCVTDFAEDTITLAGTQGPVRVHPNVFHAALETAAPNGWQVEQQRIADAEAKRLRDEAEAIAKRQREEAEAARAAQAAALNVPVESIPEAPEPPPMEAPPPVAKPTTITGARSMSYEVRTVKIRGCDLVAVATHHPEWLTLNEAAAKAAFRADEKNGTLPEPVDGAWFAHGCEFYIEKSVAVR